MIVAEKRGFEDDAPADATHRNLCFSAKIADPEKQLVSNASEGAITTN